MVLGKTEKEENLIVEVFTADAYDISVGYIVTPYNSSGIKMAVTTDKGPYFMAMMPKNRLAGTTPRSLAGSSLAYDYSEDGSDSDVPCVVQGVCDVKVSTSNAIDKGEYVEITTGGTGTVQKSDCTNWYEIVGIAMETILTTSSHGLVLLGTYP